MQNMQNNCLKNINFICLYLHCINIVESTVCTENKINFTVHPSVFLMEADFLLLEFLSPERTVEYVQNLLLYFYKRGTYKSGA